MNSRAADEAQIRGLMEARGEAVRAKDALRLMDRVAPDVRSFDVVNPLQYVGSASSKARAEQWFSSFEGPIGYEVRDVSIVAGADVAFCHCLTRVSGRRVDGGEIGMWLRTTVCFQKVEGDWVVTHEHNSVPFEAESGKASLDLQP